MGTQRSGTTTQQRSDGPVLPGKSMLEAFLAGKQRVTLGNKAASGLEDGISAVIFIGSSG